MAVLVFIYGLITGSFLNVCIYRIPRQMSVVNPPSACPACGHRLRWFELVPLVSFIIQRGRCLSCSAAVAWRYPIVEILTGAFFSLSYYLYGLSIDFWTVIILASLMLVVAFIDIEHRIIPNRLVIFGLAAGLVMGLLRPDAGIVFMAKGLLAGFGALFAVAVLSRGQMGFGDVKLAAVMGLFLGWQEVLLALFLAFLAGAIYGIFLMVFMGKGRKTAVPFGPFLAGATIAVYLWAEQITLWYIQAILG